MRVPKREDRQILLLTVEVLNNGKTSQCAQGTNQVSCCSCDAWEMVELHKNDYLVDLAPSINQHYGW